MAKVESVRWPARMLLSLGAMSASFAAQASDFTGLGYVLIGLYTIGFIVIYTAAWLLIARGIANVGRRLFVHAAVLGFFLTPTAGDGFPFPAGLMLIVDEDRLAAFASIVVGVLLIWGASWFVHAKIKPGFDEISREAREHSERE
ncbi:MAG: hypothetical protein ACREP7_05665 [Lysobacter sp.]